MRISDWSSDVCSSDLRDPQVESILRNRVFRPCLSEALGRALPIWLGEGEAEESASGCERGPLRAPISDVRSDTALSQKLPFVRWLGRAIWRPPGIDSAWKTGLAQCVSKCRHRPSASIASFAIHCS